MRSLEQVNIRTNVRTYVLTYIRTGQTLYPLHNFVVRGDNYQIEAELITSYCSYARPTKPGPIRTRLCGPCIAAKAGFEGIWFYDHRWLNILKGMTTQNSL